MAGAVAAATARYPLAPAVIDEEGRLSYADLWAATDGVARGLRIRGVGPRSTVGVLARNHRGFVIAVVAAAKLGADIVYLNTGFAAPQLADVVAHEGIDAVLHDDEFADVVAGCGAAIRLTGRGARRARRRAVVPAAAADAAGRPPGDPHVGHDRTAEGRGADRRPAASTLSRRCCETIPIRARDTVVIAAPLFHAWGLVHLGVGLGLSSTAVLQSRFDPEATLAAVAANEADGLVVVPVMLQRILALDEDVRRRYDTSSLRYIASSGSALGAPLATPRWTSFGPILYNIYGSTEVSLATVAGPADLRAAPSTAGRPAPGSVVRILDDDGNEVADRARSAASSSAALRGSRATRAAAARRRSAGCCRAATSATSTTQGRLFIDGRDDDMIVSGGENVFPREVEDLLGGHPAIAEVAVVGVADEEFGQRLRAFVVKRPGAKLTAKQVKDHVARPPRPLQGAQGGRVRRRPPADDHRQGPPPQAPLARTFR